MILPYDDYEWNFMGLYFKIGKTCECNSLMELILACTGGRNVNIAYRLFEGKERGNYLRAERAKN